MPRRNSSSRRKKLQNLVPKLESEYDIRCGSIKDDFQSAVNALIASSSSKEDSGEFEFWEIIWDIVRVLIEFEFWLRALIIDSDLDANTIGNFDCSIDLVLLINYTSLNFYL